MKNADMPAMPIQNVNIAKAIRLDYETFPGLTKREDIAKTLLAGMMSNCAGEEIGYEKWAENWSAHAVMLADALLKELEK